VRGSMCEARGAAPHLAARDPLSSLLPSFRLHRSARGPARRGRPTPQGERRGWSIWGSESFRARWADAAILPVSRPLVSSPDADSACSPLAAPESLPIALAAAVPEALPACGHSARGQSESSEPSESFHGPPGFRAARRAAPRQAWAWATRTVSDSDGVRLGRAGPEWRRPHLAADLLSAVSGPGPWTGPRRPGPGPSHLLPADSGPGRLGLTISVGINREGGEGASRLAGVGVGCVLASLIGPAPALGDGDHREWSQPMMITADDGHGQWWSRLMMVMTDDDHGPC
jgi:hypothetical protein